MAGSSLAEQRQAIELACGTRPFVVIEGHAGTGKSTTLTGIARAHQAAERQIIVTSTAAVAAERLARELATAGIDASTHSTVALHNAITSGQLDLGAGTTIIHDEAALASTREQERLLASVEQSGARLIEVGDPRQSHPVGAGGLWPHLEHAARHAGAHVELTQNQRARDSADRRDQALFRDGRHEHAVRGYAARDRVHITGEQSDAENNALDAAHADRTAGKATIVIAQTSNEHLDELNARAQAIRHQHGQLGPETLPIRGRPYALRPGDEVQIRRTIPYPDHGQLRNGSTALVADVDPDAHTVDLLVVDGQKVTLDGEQARRADLRLAYVQHPFPAQGQTTDTAHLIIGERATQEGSYVALTRAREQTHMYAVILTDEPSDSDRMQKLSERMSRTEPDLPSIHTPLAQETAITTELSRTAIDAHHDGGAAQLGGAHDAISPQSPHKPTAPDPGTSRAHEREPAGARAPAPTQIERQPETSAEPESTADRSPGKGLDQCGRAWPREPRRGLATPELTKDPVEDAHRLGRDP